MLGQTRIQLILGLVALSAASLAGFLVALPISLPEAVPRSAAAAILPDMELARPALAREDLDGIVAMLERVPPAPLPPPSVEMEVASAPKGPDYEAIRRLTITGVVLTPTRQIAIVGMPGEAQPRLMEPGEEHAGWILKALAADFAEFTSGDASERLWVWPQ